MAERSPHFLWLAVGCGGFLGSCIRYELAGWVWKRFPVGTLAVNVAGCLIIGVLMSLVVRAHWQNTTAQAFWIGGFLGALTTFSTFGYQSVTLLKEGDTSAAMLNVALNLGLGLLAVWIGLACGEALIIHWMEREVT